MADGKLPRKTVDQIQTDHQNNVDAAEAQDLHVVGKENATAFHEPHTCVNQQQNDSREQDT